jgi:YD repeat-containing protein
LLTKGCAMEKLLKTLIILFVTNVLFLSPGSLSSPPPPGFDSNPNDIWYFFNSVKEAEEYSKRVYKTCCVFGSGYIIYGKDGVRYNGGDVIRNGEDIGNVYVFGFRKSCPSNTWFNPDTGQCTAFVLGVPNTPPKNSCGVGNPVEVGTGVKFQQEIDIPKGNINYLYFERYYNAAAKAQYIWTHNYTKSLIELDNKRTDSRMNILSDSFSSESAACLNGWGAIKNKITEFWAKNSTAEFKNGSCYIVRDNVVVNTLPIIRWFEFSIKYDVPVVELQRPGGESYIFTLGLSNKYTSINGAPGVVEKVINGASTSWKFTTETGAIENYLSDGTLASIVLPGGVIQTFIYDSVSGLLSKVQDSTGHKLTFTYIGNLLTGVATDDNQTTAYTYNSTGLITDVKRADNTHRLYHYEDSRFPTYLTGITDERGVRYATWAYDSQGRAISSEHAGGAEKTLLAFNTDGSTTVTNPLNKQTIYRFDDVAGARRVIKVEGQPTANCAGANQNYTYTPEGLVASKTDWKGVKTTYQYNDKGQEISRTEAYGTPVAKTITTEWHSALSLKTKITEPDKEIIYTYDTNGLLLNEKNRSLVQ